MNWFNEWFYRKVRWAMKRGGIENPYWKDQEDYLDEVATGDARDDFQLIKENIEYDTHRLYDGLRIDIKRLNGGYIVTFKQPCDTKSQYIGEDENRNSYIVNDDEDFNERLGKLITMELLK
jgi:hypothetical protein